MRFIFKKTSVPGVLLVKPEVRQDLRGSASEQYKWSEFRKAGIKDHFVQENRSVNRRGVLRGLHYQRAPQGQARLVRCGRGRAFVVAADLRKGSPTYGRAVGVELSEANGLQLYAPAGCAHGFYALTEGAEVAYKCSREYSPAHDAGLRWDSPCLRVKWPGKRPKLSARDAALPVLKKGETL